LDMCSSGKMQTTTWPHFTAAQPARRITKTPINLASTRVACEANPQSADARMSNP
jgi:hypothetical protein